MRILKIEIDSFGKLREFSLEPTEGITVIEGENESGKSTLLAFLRFALYGFPRKNAPDGDERDKRLSWQTHIAAGRLTLAWQGDTYRIARRCISRSTAARESVSEELSVVKLPEGQEVPLEGKTPGEYFLGLPPELYDGSLSLVQSGADRVSASGMGEAVGELLFSDEAVFSAEEAEARLQAARRALRYIKGRGGRIAELEDEISALDGALVTAKEEKQRLAVLQSELAEQRARIEEKRKELSCITGAFEGADIDRTLALFEDLRLAQAEEDRCRGRLEQLDRQNAETLPDSAMLESMTAELGRMSKAERELATLTPEIERLNALRYNEKLLLGAKRIEELGEDTEKVPKRVAKQAKRVKRRGVLSALCLVLGGTALAAAHFLTAYRQPMGIGGAALLVLCFIFFCGALGARRSVRRTLRAFGAQDAAMFRTYLEQCKREGASYRAHTARVEELQAQIADATARRDGAVRALREGLLPARCDAEIVEITEESVRAYLQQSVQRGNAAKAELADATIAYERAVSVREVLANRVKGADEAALRERRAAIAYGQTSFEELHRKREQLEREVATMEEAHAETARAESALLAVARDADALLTRRRTAESALREAEQRLKAIQMASAALKEAAEEMRQRVIPDLSARASALFAELTGDAHGDTLRVADDLSMTLEGEGIPRPLAYFSAGCRDIAHLSLRLALLETVSGERLPLFFDEAFSRLDDRRAAQLLRVLERYAAGGGQCLLFTCHGREAKMLSDDSALHVML